MATNGYHKKVSAHRNRAPLPERQVILLTTRTFSMRRQESKTLCHTSRGMNRPSDYSTHQNGAAGAPPPAAAHAKHHQNRSSGRPRQASPEPVQGFKVPPDNSHVTLDTQSPQPCTNLGNCSRLRGLRRSATDNLCWSDLTEQAKIASDPIKSEQLPTSPSWGRQLITRL